MNSNRAVIPTQDDFVVGMQRLTSAEVQKIIDDYRQVLVTGLEILPKEKTDVDSLQVCNGGGSTEEGMVLSQAPDQPAPSEGQEPVSTTKTESVPSGAGTANVAIDNYEDFKNFAQSSASESSRIATMTAILGTPYGETNVANASENPASETSTGSVDSSQGLDDGHSLSEVSTHDVNRPIEGSRNPD